MHMTAGIVLCLTAQRHILWLWSSMNIHAYASMHIHRLDRVLHCCVFRLSIVLCIYRFQSSRLCQVIPPKCQAIFNISNLVRVACQACTASSLIARQGPCHGIVVLAQAIGESNGAGKSGMGKTKIAQIVGLSAIAQLEQLRPLA